jgi:hypothetical protein
MVERKLIRRKFLMFSIAGNEIEIKSIEIVIDLNVKLLSLFCKAFKW